MLMTISKLLLIHPLVWRILGFGSSIVGFSSFALSSSFYDLFGMWNPLKIVIYSVTSLALTTLMLLVKKRRRFTRQVLVKANVGFLVLMLTSLLSVWEDQVSQKDNQEKGSRGKILNLCSFGAFGLMSLSLSRQLELGFEAGIFNFFLGCFVETLLKMNFKWAPLAAILCYVLIHIRSFSDFLMEMRGRVDSVDIVHEDIERGSCSIHLQDWDLDSDEASSALVERMSVPENLTHKNRLQQYTRSSHMPLPIYETVSEGPAHCPRFRSTVWVDGKSYTSEKKFSSRKAAAEQDVAKLAFELIITGVKDEGPSLLQRTTPFKSILNQYAEKMKLDKITYDTVPQEGPPGFVSSLVFNDRRYTGDPAKSKKEAEQFAARAAVLSNLGSDPFSNYG